MRPGFRLNVRGRSVKLRGLRRAPTGMLRWLAILGPGVIASVAGDDAGGVGTISAIGARYGYELLWVLMLLTVSLAVVQEMAARLGAASGRGLLDLVRERFGIGWACVAVVVIVLANAGIVVTEFAGIAAAAELIGVNRWVAVLVSALLIGGTVFFGTYHRVGYKLGAWRDVGWWELALQPLADPPPEPRAIASLIASGDLARLLAYRSSR